MTMLKFTIEKKKLDKATALLNQVSGLKSVGSTPAESSGITLTPTTVTLTNINDANAIVIENINFNLLEGDVSQHLAHTYMVNTKKLDSIVKGCKQLVTFCITDAHILITEGKRKFELAMFKTIRQESIDTTIFTDKVNLSKVIKNLAATSEITSLSSNFSDSAGILITPKALLATDRACALAIFDHGLFTEADTQSATYPGDMILIPDLFAACAAKIDTEEEAYIGVSTDFRRFVLRFSNIILMKALRTDSFPKVKIQRAIEEVYNNDERVENMVYMNINPKEFMDKLKDLRSIVEAEEYFITLTKDGTLQLSNSNNKNGTEGSVVVEGTPLGFPVNIPEDSIGAKFAYAHLDTIGTLFQGLEKITVSCVVKGTTKAPTIQYAAVRTDDRCLIILPRAQA